MVRILRKTGSRRSRSAWAAALLAGAISCLGPATAQADGYRLGSADRVRIKVVEFNKDSLVPTEWSVMTGDYAVSDTGVVVLPILGALPAAGLTMADLNGAIVGRVKEVIGLDETRGASTSITASVEIVEYRPFFVLGVVATPGAYPFRPDMTVLQAVSLAGGHSRITDQNGWSLQRDAITAQGTLRGLQSDASALRFRQARLQAELAQSDHIAFPDGEATAAPAERSSLLEKIRQDETAIFESRAREIRGQSDLMDRQKALLENEVESLQQQIDAQNLQSVLISKDLQAVSSLADRGLVTAARRLALERATSEVQSKVLEFQTSVIQVRQDINRVDRERAALLDKRRNDIAAELSETQRLLDGTAEKRATSETILSELAAAGSAPVSAAGQPARVTYSIVRRNASGGFVEEIDVPESTLLQPGDTVKVMLDGPVEAAARASALGSPVR